METTLYQWQEECLEKWFENRSRGMVQAATGSGKTRLALTAAARLEKQLGQDLYVRIVVPTGALLHQWKQALHTFWGERREQMPEIGLRGGGSRSPLDCRYMIYVINSARYELARQILAELKDGKAVLLIADECHRYESGQNQLIFEFLPHIRPYEDHFFSLGLSATLPSGQQGHYLSSVLGHRIYSYGIKEAAAMRTVCPYDLYHISLSFQQEEQEEYEMLSERMTRLYNVLLQKYSYLQHMNQRERFDALRRLACDQNPRTAHAASQYMSATYARKRLVCLASARISCVCDLIARLGPDEKILVFGERIEQAESLYHLLQKKYPGKIGRCHSKMGALANKNVLERFRWGETRILIACKSLDEGVDIPDASIGIILSGTSMQRQRIQRLGRIIRRADQKVSASLYYLHMADTSEDICYLPDTDSSHILELQYLAEQHHFSNPDYDQAAEAILADTGFADPARIQEILRCLQLGSVRTDWLLDLPSLEQHIREAKNVKEKNYWICMKKIVKRR